MPLTGSLLTPADFTAFSRFIAVHPEALVYHTPEYLDALSEIIPGAQRVIFGVRKNDQLIAVFTGFLMETEAGRIFNASPYFGSHGDILIDESTDSDASIDCISEMLWLYIRDKAVDSVNIVAHPMKSHVVGLAQKLGLSAWDSRIGQISLLPGAEHRQAIVDGILSQCRQKTRNQARKSLRGAFDIKLSDHEDDWAEFTEHHRRGMERIGGRAKAPKEFSALRRNLGSALKLYVAYRGTEFTAGLLILSHREWLEYFTPVVVEAYRSEQPLSALIIKAMADGVITGKRYWNWGGTWHQQSGVYHFKHGWGAIDYPYIYYGKMFTPRLANLVPSELTRLFPYFYVRPFV
ncbi:GNAT family N-acetyltransferase [Methylobacterium sp. J-070]|uniref:GNAT family N-acetyltransferase n=1 Tax=Methylobacterium sp. J-070 TaxID=2836650 RepID=UPI001FB8F013|nr:GNAT family N-acetyltransferase [Methylobacterium sp. J-070]MCJ2054922.1 GNAT family N-acetyltransferase [Methylobacterium sp. J-070]